MLWLNLSVAIIIILVLFVLDALNQSSVYRADIHQFRVEDLTYQMFESSELV